MRNKSLLISATTHFEESGETEWGWSFWCAPGKTADEIAEAADFDNDAIRESTVGRIREAGFEVVSDSACDDHCRSDRARERAIDTAIRTGFRIA